MGASIKELEKKLGIEIPFDPSQWLSNNVASTDKKQSITTFARKRSFAQICTTVREELKDIVVDGSTGDDENGIWLERQHKAVIGDKNAMSYFIGKITEVLQKHNITTPKEDYPNFYDSLAEAIFHEVWGVSILHKWEKYPDSEAAVIRGCELWLDIKGKFVKQTEEFDSFETVERVKRTFTLRTKDAVISDQSPELEIERQDGSRITMLQPPRSRENYVMFRRFVVKDLSLAEQAKLQTILEEDVSFFRSLSRVMVNIVVAGRVRSAKSTFLKSLIRERDPDFVPAVLEKHFELDLSNLLKGQLVFELQAKEGDLHHAMPRLLRMEHDYILVGEMRSLEAEGYLQSTERGERGSGTTYHLTDVRNIVPQITRHILDEFPNRNFDNELERVARNIDIIITMSSDRDRRRKRCIGVTEVIWDADERKVYTHDLIRYSSVTQQYYYSSNITKHLLLLMAEENLEETKVLLNHLRQREKISPMEDYLNIQENILETLLGEDVIG